MKKVVLFVAVLMLAGLVSLSAQTPEPKLEVALSGEASFTFGINLDAVDPADLTTDDGGKQRVVSTGIRNDVSNDATLTILASADYEKGGAEGEEVYGWIKLKEIEISGEAEDTTTADEDDNVVSPVNVSVGEVEAKLFLGPVYINVLGNSNEIDKAGAITELFVTKSSSLVLDPSEEFPGVAVGLKDESVISFVVGLASRFDYKDSNADDDDNFTTDFNVNVFNDYRLFAGIGLTAVEGLTLEADVAYYTDTLANGDDKDSTLGFDAYAAFSIGIAEGIALVPSVGFDFQSESNSYNDNTSSEMQLTGGLALTLPGSALDDWDTLGTEVDIATGLSAIFSYNSTTDSTLTEQADPGIDLGVYFFDADLIPVLNLVAAFEISDLGADTSDTGAGSSSLGFGAYVEAVLDQLKPWAKFYTVSTTTGGETTTDKTVLGVGVDFTVITNTTISISYNNSGLANTYNDGTDDVADADLGTIEFTVKVAY